MHESGALVALSGGVDSSMALYLSQRRFPDGDIRAAYVDTCGEGISPEAADVAEFLGVELLHMDASARFHEEILSWAAGMLSRGMTPNPCARCNSRIKLGLLHEELRPGELLVTGHYAGLEGDLLTRGSDRNKDQSYFLSLVPCSVISSCFFPLERMNKDQVRRMAEEASIPFRREESQDLCFQLPEPSCDPGRILDIKGSVIGEHGGLGGYTVGQRKGFGAFGRRMYVVSLDPVENTVVIGERKDLASRGCILSEMNWLREPAGPSFTVLAQTRYRRPPVEAEVNTCGSGLRVVFQRSEEAVAPGQVCALYLDEAVIGGGIIQSTF